MTMLPGSEKYMRIVNEAEPAKREAMDLIQRANDLPILDVLRDWFELNIPDSGDRSWKDYCPFGWEHPDGGVDRGWRVYPSTNSSYCFVLHGALRPVRMVQMRDDVRATIAAKKLLEHYGKLRPRGYRQRMEELIAAREMVRTSLGSPADLIEALQHNLFRMPGYIEHQYDPKVAAAVDAALGRLDDMLADRSADTERVRAWLDDAEGSILLALAGSMSSDNGGN